MGKKTCEEFSLQVKKDEPFFTGFASRFCTYFEGKPKRAIPETGSLGPEFFSGVAMDGKVQGFSDSQDAEFDAIATETLQKSGWFDPKANRKLKIQFSGTYSEIHRQQPVDLRANYFIDEPFTEMVRVEKTRTVPRIEKDLNGLSVTRYHNETYTAMEPKTSYRKVERVFTYNGVQHQQRLSFDLKSTWDPSGLALLIAQTDRSDVEGVEHHENQPKIGLTPKMPPLALPMEWIQKNRKDWQSKSAQALAGAWKALFCSDAQNANRVLKCVRQELPEYPAVIESWFDQNLGLPSGQALSLISRR
jgi:hypothetical protein